MLRTLRRTGKLGMVETLVTKWSREEAWTMEHRDEGRVLIVGQGNETRN
jgi:hypothetical protein